MGKINRERLRRDKERADKRSEGGGADLWTLEEGEHLVYVIPTQYEDIGIPYVEFEAHFQFGRSKKMIVNLSNLDNDQQDIVRAFLDSKDNPLSWEEAEEGWERAGELARKDRGKRIQLKPRWLVPVMQMGFRKRKGDDWDAGKEEPAFIMCGKQIYDGLADALYDDDITDPEAAIFLRIKRKGSKMNTEYTVSVDPDSSRNPEEISEELYGVIEAWSANGAEGDPYMFLSTFVKTEDQVEAVWDGSYDEDDDDDDDRGRRGRRGRDDDDGDRGRSGRGRSRDDDEDEKPNRRSRRSRDDDDEDEKPNRRSRRSRDDEDEKPNRRSRRSRDDEDEDEKPNRRSRRSRDEEEEEEEKPRTESRRRSRKGDDDKSDDDKSEGDDEEEQPKRRRRTRSNDDEEEEEDSDKGKGEEDSNEDSGADDLKEALAARKRKK